MALAASGFGMSDQESSSSQDAQGSEVRPSGYPDAGSSSSHQADTADTGAQHRAESDTPGDDTADTAQDTADTPGDHEQLEAQDAQELDDQEDLEPAVVESAGSAAPAKRRHDWPTVKRYYVEGVKGEAEMMHWPTLTEVAAHFGIGAQRVREKSATEGWVEERNKWQAQVEATRRQARAAALAQSATQLDGKALDTAKMGLQLCMTRLQEIAETAARRRAEGAGQTGAPVLGIDAQEQQRLAQAVDLWHKIGLRAIGDPETHRLEISGPNGRPLEIAHELRRDDPGRIAGVLSVLRSAGLGDLFGVGDDAVVAQPSAAYRGDDAVGAAAGDRRDDGHQAAIEARR